MAKITFDGFYSWFTKLIVWFIAPKDFSKTTLLTLLEITLGDYAVVEDAACIGAPGLKSSERSAFLRRIFKKRFVRIDEGVEKGLYDWLQIKKLTSSSSTSYRELYQLVKHDVDRVGMFGVAGNPAQAPGEPKEPGDKERNMIVNHTMLSHFGDVEDQSARKFIKMDRLHRPDVLRTYRRAFLLMLKDHYHANPVALPESMVNARELWLVGDPESQAISRSDTKPVETQCDVAKEVASAPSASNRSMAAWIAEHVRPNKTSMCERLLCWIW